MKNALVLLGALSLGGCASIVNDSTHSMRVETLTASGQSVTGAECSLSNDYGTTAIKSGSTHQVRRSSKDMDITCKHSGQPDAAARAISRANAGLAGNIIFGGVVGAVIDHTKGTAYTYPTWVQLVFGQTLVFDRYNEKEGAPTPPLAKPQAQAASTSARVDNSALGGHNPTATGCYQGAAPCGR